MLCRILCLVVVPCAVVSCTDDAGFQARIDELDAMEDVGWWTEGELSLLASATKDLQFRGSTRDENLCHSVE